MKDVLHKALRSLLEEILQTTELHYKKNYLARVNQWYTKKLAVIDEKLRRKPLPSKCDHSGVSKKTLKKQMSMKKKQEEIENDPSPVKKIKLERSPANKTKFPPINKFDSSVKSGERSPYKKYYEEQSFSKKKIPQVEEDDFSGKVLSLKRTQFTDYDTPYKENLILANKQGLEMWKTHREKKISLNRSQEQLQRKISKWGHQKSFHYERSLACADRHSIVYNNSNRTWKVQKKNSNKKDLSQSLFMSHDKFLETDDEDLGSSDGDEYHKPVNVKKDRDYSFDEEDPTQDVVNQYHDMTYMTTDHDAAINASFIKDDSFFLTKKMIEEAGSPKKGSPKKSGAEKEDLKENSKLNPIMKLNKIQKLRHMKAQLLGASKIPEPGHVDTIFSNESAIKRHVSLSLYSRPKSLLSRTAMDDYNGNESFAGISMRKQTLLQKNAPLESYQSNHSQQRTRQLDEIINLQSQLTRQDIN